MEAEQLRYLLALLTLPGIGPITAAKIHQFSPDLSRLFNDKGQCIEPLEGEVDWASVDADLKWAEGAGGSNCAILTLDNPLYPAGLKEIYAPPPILFAKGDLSFLNQSQIAMVGSRNPTPEGWKIAFQFAEHFSKMGLTVTSGLALGVDAAAHRGALKGKSGTIAVLGNGLAQIYPKCHIGLAQEIADQGVLLSEFSIHEGPEASHFPRRNRIIAGLSLGTLVVEAALKSGSLITAQYALDQGREVFAMPGSIHSPLAKGCHQLIQQGAKLVETAQDVLEELELQALLPAGTLDNRRGALGWMEKRREFKFSLKEEKDGLVKLLDKVSYGITTVDALVETTGLTVAKVSSMLLELELKGAVVSVPGGYSRVVG